MASIRKRGSSYLIVVDVNCQNTVRRSQKGAVYPPSPVTPGLHHGDH